MTHVKYTNRRGQTFHLHARLRKDGREAYAFMREPGEGLLSKIPAGYEINEGVHGHVSLRKKKPRPIKDAELAVVNKVLASFPHLRLCKAQRKGKTIEVFEPRGTTPTPEPDEDLVFFFRPRIAECDLDYWATMRFVLVDPKLRSFSVERMCYRSWVDGWLSLRDTRSLDELAQDYLPHL